MAKIRTDLGSFAAQQETSALCRRLYHAAIRVWVHADVVRGYATGAIPKDYRGC